MTAANFGLTSDEFSFLGVLVAALIVVAAPLYISSFLQGRRAKTVVHQVTHNGGTDSDDPTLKDYSHGAYAEAFGARLTAEEARRQGRVTAAALDDHLVESKEQGEAILERISKIETITQADTRREGT